MLAFFALTLLLTIPFWVLDALAQVQLMPGITLAALAVVCPAVAALILSYRTAGRAGAVALLKRAFDLRRIRSKRWWAVILLLSPAITVAAFVALRLGGSPVPDPHIGLLTVVGLSLVFLVAAQAEELGWSGFATERLQTRWGALGAALAIGVVWALWHYPALLMADRSAAWIGWWTLGTVATRVIMVWLFNNTGRSVFGAAVFHAMSNLAWQVFPVRGSYFDQRLDGLILAGVALAVILLWGPSTLSSWGWRARSVREAG